ncbi:MAG: DUF4249 domain-containing protein [Tannerella sp.]|jgi:hypothetical protein|nr:DUF4249 domain-containing protein [Tannerella sp.]
MKRLLYTLTGCICLILNGCITEYEAKGIDEEKDILVVEGIITEGETLITLSRSVNLTDDNPASIAYINDALVFVECDDGTRIQADESDPVTGFRTGGRYLIQTGQLNTGRKYRLKIEVVEDDCLEGMTDCTKKNFEYYSDYLSPILTPEIDSVFWTKKDKGQPVNIHVATHSPDSQVLYYRWSYREDWEINSDLLSFPDYTYPYYCWNGTDSRGLLIGSAEKTVFGRLTDIIAVHDPTDKRLEVLYRIDVKQNAISKRAYDYFTNIKKNASQTGSIFAPILSELRGNITCTTEPSKPVIGYIDVSTTTQSRRYIARSDGAYEFARRPWDCEVVPYDTLLVQFEGYVPVFYVPYHLEIDGTLYYTLTQCIDCTYFGTVNKPEVWPNDH